jgi:exonuclease SbcC
MGFWSFFTKNEVPEFDIDVLEYDLEQLNAEIKRQENIKLVLEDACLRSGLYKKMMPDRKHLVEGKPCFLCGALQHPFAISPPVIADSQQALIDQNAKIKAIQADLYKLNLKLANARKQTEQEKARQTRKIQLKDEWIALSNRLNVSGPKMDIYAIRLMNRLIVTQSRDLEEVTSLATKYRKIEASIDKLTVAIEKSNQFINYLQESCINLEAQLQERAGERASLQDRLSRHIFDESHLAEEIEQQLTLLGEKMPGKSKENALFDRLNARKLEYHSYDYRYKSLSEDIALLSSKKVVCQQEISDGEQKLIDLQQQLQVEQTIGLHVAVIEKQKLIVETERYLLQLDTETMALEQDLLQKLNGSAFDNLNALNKILAIHAQKQSLEQQLNEIELEKNTKITELERLVSLVNSDLRLVDEDMNPEQLLNDIKALTEKLEIANLEVSRLERLLNQQQQSQTGRSKLLAELHQQEQLSKSVFVEAALLTEGNGMEFRRKVQLRIAEKLLSQTNAILEKISGRYYVRLALSEQGLALEIEDTFQTNTRRLPRSLSGGESFIVSLALALGLCEMANNGRSVDSLFLDEGFGNLDLETLYIVITTLENLHAQAGKTVGVISHVEAVQKSFKAQLQVVKKANGLGMLKYAS